jgi:trigger factor
MYAKTEAVNRPIQTGDFVMVDLKGIKVKAAEGEPTAIDRPGLPVFVSEGEKDDEFPFKGFSKELVGLSGDETKNFSHRYEKDYKDENFKGQTIKFEITVKMVRGSILPDLNDDFAKQVGPFENLQALREAVKANLAKQSKAEYDDDYFTKLIEKIKEKAEIKYPPQVVNHELEHVMEDLKSRLSEQGLDMTAYLKSREMDEEKFVAEEAKPIAIKRLERSLILDELSKVEKIDVSREILQSTFEQTWGEYQGNASFQKSMRGKSQPPKQMMNAVAMESANRAYIQQTLNRLKDIAMGIAPELSEDDTKKTASKKSSKAPSQKNKIYSDSKTSGRKKIAPADTLSKVAHPEEDSKKHEVVTPSLKGKKTTPNK